GLLADLTQAIAGERSNIRRIEARSGDSEQSSIAISLEASDVKHLEKILGRLRNVRSTAAPARRDRAPRSGSAAGFGSGSGCGSRRGSGPDERFRNASRS